MSLFVDTAGDMIAIGSQNGSIYLFRVSRDGFTCKKLSKIRGSQPLMQLDWSSDNNFIQAITADYDLAYCKHRHYAYLNNKVMSANYRLLLSFRGCQRSDARKEPYCDERCEMEYSKLLGWIPNSW